MICQRFLPALALQRYIHIYGVVTQDFVATPIQEKVPPTLGRGVVFYYEHDEGILISTKKAGTFQMPRGHVLPFWSESFISSYQGPFKMVAVIFKPGQFCKFFNLPLEDLVDKAYSFEELGLKDFNILHEKIFQAKTISGKILEVDNFFKEKLKDVSHKETLTDRFLTYLPFTELNETNLKTIRKQLTNYSERQFLRIIWEELGISPKRYQKILRFNFALSLLENNPLLKQVEIAYRAGYSDQSHFGREFKKFTGVSPLQFKALYHPFLDATLWREDIENGEISHY